MGTALIVDDEAPFQLILEKQIQAAGHTSLKASSPGEAWDILRENPLVHLIFLDVNLGAESGLDFLKALKRHGLFKRIPVVMSTAVKDREQVVELIQAGISGFEVKPLRAEKIEGHLKKHACGEPLPGAFLHFTLVSEGKNLDQFRYGELIQELKEKWHFALEEWQSAIIEGEVRQAPRSVHALRGDAYYIGFEYGVDMLDTLIDCLNSGKSEEALLILKELGGVPQLLQAFLVRHKLNRSPAERDRGTPETGQPAEQESDSPDGEEPAEAAASGFEQTAQTS